jgi:hypothetical protein
MPCNRVFVRIGGQRINHRLTYGSATVNLSEIFAGERVAITLLSDDADRRVNEECR